MSIPIHAPELTAAVQALNATLKATNATLAEMAASLAVIAGELKSEPPADLQIQVTKGT